MRKTHSNQLKSGGILSLIAIGLRAVILLAYTPIMLRLLGQNEYGLYNLTFSLVSYLGLLNFGFGSAYIRYYSIFKVQNNESGIAKLNGMFTIIFSLIGIIALISGSFLVAYSDQILGFRLTPEELGKAKVLLIILIINIAFSFPNIIFNSHIIANEHFVFQKYLEILKVIANPFLVLPALLLGLGSIGMAMAITFINISIEIANMLFCFNKLKMKFDFSNFDFRLMKEMTIFSSFVFSNMVVDQVNWNIDKYILGRFYGTVSVATYGLASQLNIYYISLSTAISNLFIPRVNQLVALRSESKILTNLFTKIGRIQFLLMSYFLLVIIFFGRPFINLWAGIDYDETWLILLIITIPVTIPLIQNTGIEIQKAKNLHKFRSSLYLLIAVANIIMTIPLAKSYGGKGAAIGTAISMTIGNIILMNWYYHSKVGINIKYFWHNILKVCPGMILPIFAGLVIGKKANLYDIESFIMYCIFYTVIYCFSVWIFGMNQNEKDLIKKPVVSIRQKLFGGSK